MRTHDEMRAYQKDLQALKERLNGDVAELRAEAGQGGLFEADPNLAMASTPTDTQDILRGEEELNIALLEREKSLLAECDAALARIERGTFGRCEECGRSIPKRRLRAFPYARYCVACANRRERESVS